MIIKEAIESDLKELLNLYLYLHEKEVPEINDYLINVWKNIINDSNHHIIIAVNNGYIVSSCVCVIILNLTRNARQYAVIENVVTKTEFRNKGFATSCLNFAESIAKSADCYKIMLLTGTKNVETLQFYKHAGFNCNDKTAFIKWI